MTAIRRAQKAVEQMMAPLREAVFALIWADLQQDADALTRWENEGGAP